MVFHLLLYSKYGEKMMLDEQENDYKGFVVKTNPWNFDTIRDRAAHFGKVLSDVSGNGAYVVASVPSYLASRFLEYFDKSEARVYNIEGD
jgi:hypothetical protein